MRWNSLSFFVFLLPLHSIAWELECPFGCNQRRKEEIKAEFRSLFQVEGDHLLTLEFHAFSQLTLLCDITLAAPKFSEYRVEWSFEHPIPYYRAKSTTEALFRATSSPYPQYPDQREYGLGEYEINNALICVNILQKMRSDICDFMDNEKKCLNEATFWADVDLSRIDTLKTKNQTHYPCTVGPYFTRSNPLTVLTTFHQNLLKEIEEKSSRFEIIAASLTPVLGKFDVSARKMIHLFADRAQQCIEYHQWKGAYYERGLANFVEGNYSKANDDISQFIKASEGYEDDDLLPVEAYLTKGVIESELCLYNEAIVSLSRVIEEDPANKEAYFERAVAYFQLGEFDLSLNDYLVCKDQAMIVPNTQSSFDFALGMISGSKKGIAASSTEFFPSLLASTRGLGNLLWATIKHPIETPRQLGEATAEFFIFLKNSDKAELAQLLVPEMYDLVTNWDSLSQRERGELSGFCLGKYGTDILLPVAVIKGVKYVNAYRKIKQAEKACILQTLAESQESKQELTQAALKWDKQRREWFANVKIEPDKQGKHIPNHRNFKPGNSEWTHPDPQRILRENAGKGQKVAGNPGEAGYRERIDCGEIIGYYADKSGEKISTTMANIHYSKEGAHIVPARPKK